MNILICNDDGINSEGIVELALVLSKKHNVLVVAPDGNRSATSHSLSIFKNITVKKHEFCEKINAYVTSGTPADCVKFTHHELNKEFPIDLVVSGINRGHNLGTDVLYSGTVSAAFEGTSLGYRAMAFSCTSHTGGDYKQCAEYANILIEKLYPHSEAGFIWNVNFPNIPIGEIKGIKFAPLGKQLYSDSYKKVSEGEYCLVGEMQENVSNPDNCDVELSRNGYITITPLKYDRTDYVMLEKANKLL